jgi:type IV pilus assembly protein PilF
MKAKWISIVVPALLCAVAGCVTTTDGVEREEPTAEDAAVSHYALGAQYYKNGNYELARDRLKQSLEFDPDRALTWTTLALTYEALGNERLAEDAYTSAVRVAPRNFDVLNTYAVYLCRNDRQDEAKRYFDRAVDVPTNDYAEVTLTNAGVCMAQKPDYAAAEAYFREALENNRNYAEALLQMCVLKYRQEDYLTARAFLQRYLAGNEPTASVLALGWEIESALGDERARDEIYRQMVKDFPDAPETQRIASRS